MIVNIRRSVAVLLGLAVGLGSISAAAQDTVLSAVAVQVNPGKLDEYLARVKSLQGVLARVEASGSIEAWQVTAGGPATGTVLVVLEYPSLVSYAESGAKTEGDAEYQKLISGLDELRTLESSSLYRLVSGAATQGDIPTGSVLQSISVQVKPGRLDDYVAKIEQLRKISERVGNAGNMRVWQATAAGEATGSVVIGLIHKDLAAYAADSAKTQADSEWQALVGGLDEMRTIVSSGLARNVGP